jgi:hypothetical protein
MSQNKPASWNPQWGWKLVLLLPPHQASGLAGGGLCCKNHKKCNPNCKFWCVICRKGTSPSGGFIVVESYLKKLHSTWDQKALAPGDHGWAGLQAVLGHVPCGLLLGLQDVLSTAKVEPGSPRLLLWRQLQPDSQCKNSITLCLQNWVAQQPGVFPFLFESPHTLIFIGPFHN